jgi:hypothetical protein
MIEITHILWRKQAIGVATHKLKSGINIIKVTVKNPKDEYYFPEPFEIDKEKAIKKYGPIEEINKNLKGIFIPLTDIREETTNED